MVRKLKALGVVFTAMLVVSGATSSDAAAVDKVTSSPEYQRAILTGTSHDNVFAVPNKFEAKCTTSKFSATAENGAEQVTVFPTYSGKLNATPHSTKCNTSIGEATIDVNGCDYLLTGDTTGSDEGKADAKMSIVCPEGKSIQITDASGCTVTVPAQAPTEGGVTYTNETENGKGVVKVKATVTGITYTANFVCQLGGMSAHGDDAKYTGTVLLTGYEDKGGPTNGDEFTEGEQIGVEVT